MPAYADLEPAGLLGPRVGGRPARPQPRDRTRLLALRAALSADAARRAAPGTLVLGTWNLREFDSESWGMRLPESYAYIAEVIDRFDLVAVQEVRSDLRALDALLERLGPQWSLPRLRRHRGQGRQPRAARVPLRHDQGALPRHRGRARAAAGEQGRGAGAGHAGRAHAADGDLPGRLDEVRARHRPHPLRRGQRRARRRAWRRSARSRAS